jgi:Flp pilus assembly protein TadD
MAIDRTNYQYSLLRGRALANTEQTRLGRYAESIAVYDSTLASAPTNASLLNGRGLAKLRVGDAEGGQQDIKAATAVYKNIVETFGGYRVKP